MTYRALLKSRVDLPKTVKKKICDFIKLEKAHYSNVLEKYPKITTDLEDPGDFSELVD